jgi:hypothetical protein
VPARHLALGLCLVVLVPPGEPGPVSVVGQQRRGPGQGLEGAAAGVPRGQGAVGGALVVEQED